MPDLRTAPNNGLSARVESLLCAHPDVGAASLVVEAAADGRLYHVAYVVPHKALQPLVNSDADLADRAKKIAQWRKAFDQVYRVKAGDPAPSFVGWTSSATNKPLPETDMREWLDGTIDRILSLKPERVLEIGCGVGLLVQGLAPYCASYRGTDLSPVAIGSLREFVATNPELRHVELIEREAADLRDQPSDSVDTVVINSVVQYFPDLHYLQSVIAEAARIVRSGGRIFVGDVRQFATLPLFHSTVQLAKAPPQASVGWLKRRIALAIEQERELAIDPAFFTGLTSIVPRLQAADVLLKRGHAHNELTKYRYDVVLHVGDTSVEHGQPRTELQAGAMSMAEILSHLADQPFTPAVIRNVPNRRLAHDIDTTRRLWAANARQTVSALRSSQPDETGTGLEPEDIWALADQGRCAVRIHCPAGAEDGRFDVELAPYGRMSPIGSHMRPADHAASAARPLASNPLEVAARQQLGLELHQMLRDRLPEDRLPAAVIAVEVLPTSAECPILSDAAA